MRQRFDGQLALLNRELINMGALCEEAIAVTARSVLDADRKQAERISALEEEIDQKEREIERICLRLLLQQQPVARDLRLISSALKMISDMERIGDQAFDIAELTAYINDASRGFCREHINVMTDTAIKMVNDSVTSFVKKDLDMARSVIDMDDISDDMFDKVKMDLINAISENKDSGEIFIDMLMIAKYLERICDHAENIAEWVIFSITGSHVTSDH